ncbi:MAG: phenylalanine--tRNA ligase subunit beta [Candidatus Paceibacterota bacterium]
MKISYNWLKSYIPETPDVDKLVDIFNYHLCEMESLENMPDSDVVFDIKVLPNRAHDLLSHRGIAQELSSLFNIPFVDPILECKVPESKSTKLKIEIKTDKCRRYAGRIIKNVKVSTSPEWMIKYLESIGQRSINNIVDASNIVMYGCGQPTHAFDLDKVDGEIIIRDAKDGEKMTTLDNKEVNFKSSNIVIADSKNTLAIAGIKGGKIAEVDNNTKNIILEVANFDSTSVRKTAQALNIFTDARKRYENDLSPELVTYAMKKLSALILEMCPEAIFEEIVDVYPKKQEIKKLSFSVDRISKILGLTVSANEIKDILKRYNFEFENNNGNFEIVVPSLRLDLTIEEDMAEEIGRILGYDKVKGKVPKINFQPKQNKMYAKILWARTKLLNDGYSEIMNSTFCNNGEVEVLASASDKKFLRTNLTDGLKESLKLNQLNAPLLGMNEIKIFEIGTVFKKDKEEMHVAYGDKKEIKEMSLDEFYKKAESDTFDQDLMLRNVDHLQKHTGAAFKMWSLFPFIARDVAVWVPEGVINEDVAKIIKENMGNMIIKGPELFDEFKKGNQISYAFRLVFQSFERTLTDQEVNDIMTQITNKIKDKKTNGVGWQVR